MIDWLYYSFCGFHSASSLSWSFFAAVRIWRYNNELGVLLQMTGRPNLQLNPPHVKPFTVHLLCLVY